tara:strand:+ start:158 stop:598 length:441 start_codon:yes stop_codon:yes gene_type:complete
VVVQVQVMDLEHQQLENQGGLVVELVLQILLMQLEEQEQHVKAITVEQVILLQVTKTTVVVVAEKELLEEIHQEVLEELVEQEQILVLHFQEQQTALHTVVVVAVEVEGHLLDLLEELAVVVAVDHNQLELEKLELQTQVVEAVEL